MRMNDTTERIPENSTHFLLFATDKIPTSPKRHAAKGKISGFVAFLESNEPGTVEVEEDVAQDIVVGPSMTHTWGVERLPLLCASR